MQLDTYSSTNPARYIGYNTLSDNPILTKRLSNAHWTTPQEGRAHSLALPRPPARLPPIDRRRPRCARASFTAAPPSAHSTSAAVAPENSSAPDLLQRFVGVFQRVGGVLNSAPPQNLRRTVFTSEGTQCQTVTAWRPQPPPRSPTPTPVAAAASSPWKATSARSATPSECSSNRSSTSLR